MKFYANAKLVKNYRIDVDDDRGHAVCLDLEEESGGTNMGPSALELALMSFAGCYATIFMLTASKMRATIKDLEIKVEAVKSEQAGTVTETKFDITTKTDLAEDRVHRLHELTVKGCPVGKLFEKAGVKITYTLRIERQ
ncbi:MAG: OsmC family protein [Candidatus Bathyarchaeia archaeon]|jgi:putative redox protein